TNNKVSPRHDQAAIRWSDRRAHGRSEIHAGMGRAGLAVDHAAEPEAFRFHRGGYGPGEAAVPETRGADGVVEGAKPRRLRLGTTLVGWREIDHGSGQGEALDGKLS